MPNTITATPSYYQDQLSRDERFVKRIQQHMINYALTVMSEPLNTPNHAQRLVLARTIVFDGAQGSSGRAAYVIVNHANVNSTISIIDGNVTTSVNDANLQAAIVAMWNILSGIESGS